MKVAIYIKDDLTQIVLTPETEEEKAAMKIVQEADNLETRTGSFYECEGGWVRQGTHDRSTFLIVRKKEETA